MKRCLVHLLTAIFNMVLLRRFTPTSWQESRTILLPKEGDLKDPTNWRPITIGSALQRLLHRILAKRLLVCLKLNPHQRGFREIDGTLANLFTVHHYCHSRHSKGKSYNVASLDIREAFDSVSHHCIRRALRRMGVDELLTEYIMSTLQAFTTIQVGHQITGRIGF